MAELIGGDRRAGKRYALELPLRFQFSTRGSAIQGGHGITSDLSSCGVRFLADGELPPVGADIELAIDWPYLLQGVCPLEILVRGKVLQSTPRGVIVAVRSKAFRTHGRRSFEEGGYTPKISFVV